MPTIPSLIDDLVAEILSYLPFKTTTKFKTVTSSWHKLISHPRFTSLQQRRRAHCAVGFIHGSTLPRWKIRFDTASRSKIFFEPFLNTSTDNQSLISSVNSQLGDSEYFLVSSSNGLFLLGPDNDNLLVWNSITKTCISIPPLSDPDVSDYLFLMVFGLAASSPTSNCFQVVGVSESWLSYILIYSSETRSWTKLRTNARVAMSLNPVGAASVGGSMYWLKSYSVFAFNLVSRQSREMKLPKYNMACSMYAVGSFRNVWFGGFEGNLYFVFVSDDTMELWRLEKCDHNDKLVEYWKKVMEAKKSGGWGSPLFFDGRRIAFSTTVGEEWKKDCCRINFYDTFCREWQGSMNCRCDKFFGSGHCFIPCYL